MRQAGKPASIMVFMGCDDKAVDIGYDEFYERINVPGDDGTLESFVKRFRRNCCVNNSCSHENHQSKTPQHLDIYWGVIF
ncbi:hypothetical protein KSX_49850 [Ktedonospora formicarum]|uniref:Uncharacterized protein n=1 Tax=Ktedonospora formicarum TaxID=2778364 RepID=A0A8J3I667_9CHLR|nr:hypothetical protein KSX_49850 [Ktedonospora formicarum]